MDAVRALEETLAPTGEKAAGGGEDAKGMIAAVEHVDAALGIRGYAHYFDEIPAGGNLRPVGPNFAIRHKVPLLSPNCHGDGYDREPSPGVRRSLWEEG